jgi:hypothetical protein
VIPDRQFPRERVVSSRSSRVYCTSAISLPARSV